MKKIKDIGLSILLVPSGVKTDKLTESYISKIESGEILPPQYIDSDGKLIKDKIASKEEWIKSVKSQESVFEVFDNKENAVKKDVISLHKYNGVRFLGEIEPKNMKITSINQNGIEKNLDSNKNVNQELQGLVCGGYSFNDNTNWLVFNDNGTEKLIAKKPLRYYITWNNLRNAGLVFREERELVGYKPTEITINAKRYIVRLMNGYSNNNTDINNLFMDNINHYNAVKGSEWNRLILPLIDPTKGRYGPDTKNLVESNMPVIANYSWWTDFGGNSNTSGKYVKDKHYGVSRWTQEIGNDSYSYHISRGNNSDVFGASYSTFYCPKSKYFYSTRGWQPVLEKIDN